MQMKAILRQTLDTGAAGLGVLRACERRMIGGLTLLLYHRVLPDEQAWSYPLSTLAMPASMFEQQMHWLAESCRVVPVQEGLDQLGRGEPGDRPLVSVTFDDGYADNAEIAAPLLSAAGIRGTFFVTAGAVRDGDVLWHDRAILCWQRHGSDASLIAERALNLERATCGARDAREWARWLKTLTPDERSRALDACLDGPLSEQETAPFRLMSVKQVRQLADDGHEIASHTMSHALLPQLDDAQLQHELAGSMKCLEEMTGEAPRGIGYPNGDVDDRVAQAARTAGYDYGCTTITGRNSATTDRMRLMRLDMNPQRMMGVHNRFSMTAFRGEVCLLHQRLRSWRGPSQR